MGARQSASSSIGASDQFPVDKFRRCGLNFPRLSVTRRGPRKTKTKRNVSATFAIHDCESAYDSQGSNVQSCLSSLSSDQNVFSSMSSVSNATSTAVATPAAVAGSSCGNDIVNLIYGDFNSENASLNINTATEEGLMTLPGVTRQTARNIVNYRKLIGGFKNIQDIALVSGVGATLFVRFRSDITCSGNPSEPVLDQQPESSRQAKMIQKKVRSSALSKHSSTSSSGIDISTINEDDDVDGDKNHHQHLRNSSPNRHHHHHHHQQHSLCSNSRTNDDGLHDNPKACSTNGCTFE